MFPKILTPVKTLRSKTITQLKAELTTDMTKRDLLIQMTGSDRITEIPFRTYCKFGQESQTEVFRDVETNVVISTKTITWTYYKGGEVDEITIVETGSKGERRMVIKHFADGRQPEVMN